jgi:hypothetical protein
VAKKRCGATRARSENRNASSGSRLPCAFCPFAHASSVRSHGVWMPARGHSSTFPTNRPDVMLYSNPPEDAGAVFLKPVAASIVRQQHPALSEADKRQICSTPYVPPQAPCAPPRRAVESPQTCMVSVALPRSPHRLLAASLALDAYMHPYPQTHQAEASFSQEWSFRRSLALSL